MPLQILEGPIPAAGRPEVAPRSLGGLDRDAILATALIPAGLDGDPIAVGRAERVFGSATALFAGDESAAAEWLGGVQRAFGGKPGFELMRTAEGSEHLEDVIGRLMHGIFT